MSIAVKKLRYVYSPKTPFEKVALDDVDLVIDDGDFFGIIGHTGSGKSTLISHFNALTKAQSGTITIDDIILEPKRKPDYKKLRSKVGMVFQYPEYQLFDETVAKDVAFGAKNIGISGDELGARVRGAIEMVGLDYSVVSERSPFDLSGGQKRRVALAGALAMHPQILVLDEPTAGLDPRGKKEILDLIVKIKSELCPTIIMISHNMDEVAEYCNKIAVMSEGRVECVLPPDELFSKREMLARLNISMPQVTQIAFELREKGMPIATNIISESELIRAILQCKNAKEPLLNALDIVENDEWRGENA